MKARLRILLVLGGLVIAFTTGRTLGAECSYHQTSCTYRVGGCYPGPGSCELHGGGFCYTEYGVCCDGGGADSSTFCAPSCDGSGGGPPCNN
jgi:hypothetical protein